jgi:DNA-binding NtrC family response regulator
MKRGVAIDLEKLWAGTALLIVEDELLLRKRIAAQMERLGADVTTADTLEAARNLLGSLDFDLALLDIHLPDGTGMELLRDGRFPPNTGVVIMTADGGIDGAVEAMRLGALDYLVKPFEVEALPLVLGRARRARQAARLEEHRRRGARVADGFYFGRGLSALERQIAKILEADMRMTSGLPPVLIQGETGTGKTSIARWIHQRGPRAEQPLVEINCSALPETLAESELFGHERGAFTDARSARMGMFEAAHGGTLFLDELPSLTLGLQAKVLKAVEDRTLRRLGGQKEIPVDVRVVAASNADLKRLVGAGSFRSDLYHRLDLYRLLLPPLRDRQEDIVPLAEVLMDRLCQRHRLKRRRITSAGRERLIQYDWPGNVRELSHELERAIVFEEGDALSFAHLPLIEQAANRTGAREDWWAPDAAIPSKGFKLDEAINGAIRRALKQMGGNVSGAARLLGVTRDYVRYRLGEELKGGRDRGE